MFKFSGQRPATLGVRDGQLAACPSKPNCVCSQTPDDGPKDGNPHAVRPFSFEGDRGDVMTRVLAVLMAQPNCQIVTQGKDYVHAEFTSGFFGFVDDVEFYLPAQGNQLQVRSASRLGYSDLGVNRERMERLRVAFDDAD